LQDACASTNIECTGEPDWRVKMRKLILTAAMLAMVANSPVLARGGHGHSMGHSSSPANPSVPPSLTPDSRLTGSAPLPSQHPQLTKADTSPPTEFDPEDAKVDKLIKNICRGC
jgi:hypothetical protein